ncbi:MAG: hypothetical protein QOF85_2579 [Solirubrobacterales bacterium]|jgi:hypothetical protein|nr:hypothetical protein [Solirubrobacterales bacterium]
MRSLRAVGLVGTVLAIALSGGPAATAATEVGDECVGNTAEGPYSLIPEARASASALPLATPTGGVVTSWKVNSARPEPVPERMAAFRPTGTAGTFQVLGESSDENVNQGLNVFSTRIPVKAGDRFGPVAVTVDSPLFCATGNNGDQTWSFNGSVGTGSTHTFAAGVQVRVPMLAVIEPDKDGDGYGDETQDKCPQSAAYQGECPTITLDAFPIVLKRSVLVLVSASSASSVQVFGQVSWKLKPKGSARSSKASPGGKLTGLTVGLAGGTQTVTPGEIGRFNVKLPKSVRRRLGRIPPSQSLKAQLTASTIDLAGRVASKVLTVKLPGQDRG